MTNALAGEAGVVGGQLAGFFVVMGIVEFTTIGGSLSAGVFASVATGGIFVAAVGVGFGAAMLNKYVTCGYNFEEVKE